MNPDRTRTPIAIVLSILVHASIALLGNFELGETAAAAGSLSVSVADYANPAASQSPQNDSSEAIDVPDSDSPPEPEVEPPTEPITPVAPAADKPVKKPEQPKKVTTKPAKKTLSKAAVASFQKSADSKSQATAPTSKAQRADKGATAKKGIIAAIELEFSAIPLYHLIPKPPYPSRARDLGEQGTVIVSILVAVDGSVADAHVSQSSGYALLDGSALSTVKSKWRFKPARKGGKSVASWVRVPINFTLKLR